MEEYIMELYIESKQKLTKIQYHNKLATNTLPYFCCISHAKG